MVEPRTVEMLMMRIRRDDVSLPNPLSPPSPSCTNSVCTVQVDPYSIMILKFTIMNTTSANSLFCRHPKQHTHYLVALPPDTPTWAGNPKRANSHTTPNSRKRTLWVIPSPPSRPGLPAQVLLLVPDPANSHHLLPAL